MRPSCLSLSRPVPETQRRRTSVTLLDTLQGTVAEWAASDRGPNGARNEDLTVAMCKQVFDSMTSVLEDAASDTFQLILSGECLYCPAILSAYWHSLFGTEQTVGVIYMGANCDLYTPDDATGSGNIASMIMTHLTLREGCLDRMKRFGRPNGHGVVDNNNIVLFGLNTQSEANRREHLGWLLDNQFRVCTAAAIREAPVCCAKEALRWLELRVDHIVVHLNVDVIDPGEFPLGSVPSWTGLLFEQCMQALKVFLKSDKCVALCVEEVNSDQRPWTEDDGETC